jgi:antitoxin VapB
LRYLSGVTRNIEDPQTEALAAEVAALANETQAQAILTALQEQKGRLLRARRRRADRITQFLENEAWPQIPDSVRGQPVSKAERGEILGYGPEGVWLNEIFKP